jgi:hypothetical protein
VGALVGLSIILALPLGFIVSLIGLIWPASRKLSYIGLGSVALFLLFLFTR